MPNWYQKGAAAERELMRLFVSKGWSVIRAAGSGVGTACPDLLVFKGGMHYGFECKSVSADRLSIPREQFEGLQKWMENSGNTTMVAWKIPKLGWRFLNLNYFDRAEKSWSISVKKAESYGKMIDEMLR